MLKVLIQLMPAAITLVAMAMIIHKLHDTRRMAHIESVRGLTVKSRGAISIVGTMMLATIPVAILTFPGSNQWVSNLVGATNAYSQDLIDTAMKTLPMMVLALATLVFAKNIKVDMKQTKPHQDTP